MGDVEMIASELGEPLSPPGPPARSFVSLGRSEGDVFTEDFLVTALVPMGTVWKNVKSSLTKIFFFLVYFLVVHLFTSSLRIFFLVFF